MMEVKHFFNGTCVLSQGDKRGSRLLSASGAELIEIRLEPGAVLPPHTTPMDVMFYVVSGRCRITIGEETQEVPAGSAAACPAQVPHGLINSSVLPVTVLVYKLPEPEIRI